jgi:hypothetical protein
MEHMGRNDRSDEDGRLESLADAIMVEACRSGSIREGIVMSVGPTPYRRLDCDGRALAYVRTRPKKDAVRVDVPGLWHTPNTSKLQIRASAGRALLARSPEDVAEVVRYLEATVEETRRLAERSGRPPNESSPDL